MARGGCVALPGGTMGLSEVCDCSIFSDHTHYFGTQFKTLYIMSTLYS